MNTLIQALFGGCLGRNKVKVDNMANEKSQLDLKSDKVVRTTEDIAAEVIETLFSAEKKGVELERSVNNIVSEYGWTENIAIAILHGLENALKKGKVMGAVMKDAFDKATDAAKTFVKEHPVYFTIIVIGILVVLTPWVIEAIGFGELGPIEGSFAAWWQSTYAGYVPKGSLFSYLQRLGMVWRRVLKPGASEVQC